MGAYRVLYEIEDQSGARSTLAGVQIFYLVGNHRKGNVVSHMETRD